MVTSTDIRRALVDGEGFSPVSDTDLSEEGFYLRDLASFDFVVAKKYKGSIRVCAAISLRSEDAAVVRKKSKDFYTLCRSLKKHAESVAKWPSFGHGLLLVISDGPTSPTFQKLVRRQKRWSVWGQDRYLVWLLDRSLREVFVHRGIPLFGGYPSQRYFQDLLKTTAG